MSRLSGVVLILAGVGIAAYALPSRNDTAGEAIPATQSVAEEGALAGTVNAAGLQEPAPGVGPLAVPAPQPTVRPPPSPPARTAQPLPPLAAKAVPVQRERERGIEPPLRTPVSQHTAAVGPPLDRAGLARELQRQLKRVGCYDGEITGVWTPVVRRSMKAFTDRANATLPVDQPDYILLAMVQSHPDKACGRSCPAGQGLTDDGRCLPNAIIARAARKHVPGVAPPVPIAITGLPVNKQAPAEQSWSTTTTAAAPAIPAAPVPAAPDTGRMALAGPAGIENPSPSALPQGPEQAHVKTTKLRGKRRVGAWGSPRSAFGPQGWAAPRSMP